MTTPTIGQLVTFVQGAKEKPIDGTRKHPARVEAIQSGDSEPAVFLTVLLDFDRTTTREEIPHKNNAEEGKACWHFVGEVSPEVTDKEAEEIAAAQTTEAQTNETAAKESDVARILREASED